MAIPVPVGPSPAEPVTGTLGLLLLATRLSSKTQHDEVPVIGLIAWPTQRPSCGGGGSPWSWVLVSNPSLLLSKVEFLITSEPPELVPEYPRALSSIQALVTVALQTGWQAPM